jgi:hypothetical protein
MIRSWVPIARCLVKDSDAVLDIIIVSQLLVSQFIINTIPANKFCLYFALRVPKNAAHKCFQKGPLRYLDHIRHELKPLY